MKTAWFKFALFLLFFLVEVEIDAQTLTWPKGCGFEEVGCTLSNGEPGRWLSSKSNSQETHLGPKSSITRRAQSRVHLIEGQAVVINRGAAPLHVSFPSGEVKIPSEHEVYLEVLAGKVEVHAQTSTVKVMAEGSEMDLPPGLMVEKSLHQFPSRWSVPRAYAFEEMVSLRAIAGLSVDKEQIVHWAKLWITAAEMASETSRHLVERAIASDQEIQKEQQRRRAENRAEAQRLRALFLKKNYLDQ